MMEYEYSKLSGKFIAIQDVQRIQRRGLIEPYQKFIKAYVSATLNFESYQFFLILAKILWNNATHTTYAKV